MKILFVSPTGTLDNGAEWAGLNLISYLQEQGHQVYNLFPENHHESSQTYEVKLADLGVAYFKVASVAWWWQDAPGQKALQQDLAFTYYHSHLNQVRDFICKNQIDLVISNTANVFLGALAAACENIRHFWLIHEFPFGEFAYYKDRISLIDQLSDAIFAVEGELYNHLKTLLPDSDKLHSFIPFSAVERLDLTTGKERRLISIGRLTERKNQLELIRAYQMLNQPTLPLVLIGGWDPTYKEKLDTYISQNNLGNIHFIGHQANPWHMVTDQDVFVNTSLLETYGLVYLESLLHGVPSLVSDNPGHLSVQRRFGGLTYRLGDYEDLVPKLRQVLDSFEEQRRLSQINRDTVRTSYTIEMASQSILKSIQMVTHRPKSIESLSPLLGCDLEEYLAQKLNRQAITVYLDRGNDFNQEDTLSFNLEKEGTLDLDLDETVHRLRLDFSEQPSLVAIKSPDLDLNQVVTNGTPYQEAFVFLTKDPQIIVDLPKQRSSKLRFTYHYQDLFELDDNHLISRLLSERDRLQHDLNQANQAYQNVVTSRRWTIPTKIIDFFRRNK